MLSAMDGNGPVPRYHLEVSELGGGRLGGGGQGPGDAEKTL